MADYFERKKQVLNFWIDDSLGTSMLAEFLLNTEAVYSKHMTFSFDSNLIAMTTVEDRAIHFFDISKQMELMKIIADDDSNKSKLSEEERHEKDTELQELKAQMLKPIKIFKDESEEDTFHKYLKGIKMTDDLIVAWTTKEIRQWKVEEVDGAK